MIPMEASAFISVSNQPTSPSSIRTRLPGACSPDIRSHAMRRRAHRDGHDTGCAVHAPMPRLVSRPPSPPAPVGMMRPSCLRNAVIREMICASPASSAVRYPAIFDCLLSEYNTTTPSARPSHTSARNAQGTTRWRPRGSPRRHWPWSVHQRIAFVAEHHGAYLTGGVHDVMQLRGGEHRACRVARRVHPDRLHTGYVAP